MKKKYALTILPAAAVAAAVLAQGPLTPSGASVPAMKTLDQIEPRTPIANLPVTISQSGSYCLTGNLQFTAPSGHAITIAADEVTLDLMGFKLSSSNVVTGDAIHINGGRRNSTVKNGAITGNSTVTISGTARNRTWTIASAGFNKGVTAASTPEAKDCLFSCLHISRCRTDGLYGGEQAIVEKVTGTENGGSGINLSFGGNLTGCTTRLNGDRGIDASYCLLANCVATYNGGPYGISASFSALTNCLSDYNRASGITAFEASIANSIAGYNDSTGMSVANASNCTAHSNGGNGIFCGNGGSVTNSIAVSNDGNGISASGSSVTHCMVRYNGDDGISAPSGVIAFCAAAQQQPEQQPERQRQHQHCCRRHPHRKQSHALTSPPQSQLATASFRTAHSMKLNHCLLLLPAAAIAGVVFAQAPLTPPGAPAPVMKSLDQIEPRSPISSLPFTIAQSGSYYFTRNLQFTAATGAAITINAHDVTLNLMGFTLSSTSSVTDAAISVPPQVRGLCIRNGNIAGTTTVTVSGVAPNRAWQINAGGFRQGITAFYANGALFADLHIRGCREDGIYGGERVVVERVRTELNGAAGIQLREHGQLSQCSASLCGEYGIYAPRSTVTCTTVVDNKNSGMQVSYGIVSLCMARDNGGAGLSAFDGVVSFSTATGSGSGGGTGTVYSEISASGATRTGNNPAP